MDVLDVDCIDLTRNGLLACALIHYVIILTCTLMQWSFGVTSWEVFSGGKIPYGGITPMILVQLICDGERLSKPSNSACTDEM